MDFEWQCCLSVGSSVVTQTPLWWGYVGHGGKLCVFGGSGFMGNLPLNFAEKSHCNIFPY